MINKNSDKYTYAVATEHTRKCSRLKDYPNIFVHSENPSYIQYPLKLDNAIDR